MIPTVTAYSSPALFRSGSNPMEEKLAVLNKAIDYFRKARIHKSNTVFDVERKLADRFFQELPTLFSSIRLNNASSQEEIATAAQVCLAKIVRENPDLKITTGLELENLRQSLIIKTLAHLKEPKVAGLADTPPPSVKKITRNRGAEILKQQQEIGHLLPSLPLNKARDFNSLLKQLVTTHYPKVTDPNKVALLMDYYSGIPVESLHDTYAFTPSWISEIIRGKQETIFPEIKTWLTETIDKPGLDLLG